jgi:hypothetical protein
MVTNKKRKIVKLEVEMEIRRVFRVHKSSVKTPERDKGCETAGALGTRWSEARTENVQVR